MTEKLSRLLAHYQVMVTIQRRKYDDLAATLPRLHGISEIVTVTRMGVLRDEITMLQGFVDGLIEAGVTEDGVWHALQQ